MNELPKPGSFRTTQQVSELQIKLGMTVDRILRDIESAQNRINAVKQEVANRWKSAVGIDSSDRKRLAQNETSARVREIMDDVVVKLDASFEDARELYDEIENAKTFYPGKLQFLMNANVLSENRSRYATTLSLAGPMELAGYASYAIGVQSLEMAAAVIQANDALPAKDRRFQSVAVSQRLSMPAWDSLQSALKLANSLYQQVQIAVRTFKTGKHSPIDTIRLAMLNNELKADVNAEE